MRRTATALAGMMVLSLSTAEARKSPPNAIDSLQPGEWFEVPNSQMKALDPDPSRTASYSAVEGVYAVMNDWSGGAYDSQRDRLIVWGGGHGGYAGNEIYVFDVNALAWQRLTNPSDPPATDVPYAPDGGPCSRHTYNYLQYLPAPADRFCTFGGAGFYQTGQTGTQHVDAFNFGTSAWETGKFADTPANNLIGSITAFDPVTGHLWQHGGLSSWLVEFDPLANAWTAHGDQWNGTYLDYYKTADIDPKRRKLVAVGNGEVWSWDIAATGTITGTKLTTTGATGILSSNSTGFVYDAAIDQFVAWSGGANVYTLSLDTLVWSQVTPAATNTVIPTGPNSNGTFGRFRYIPSKNAFVVVNAVDQDVFVYKLSAGGGSPSPAPPPPAPPAPAPAPGPAPSTPAPSSGSSGGSHKTCGCGSVSGQVPWVALVLGAAVLYFSRRTRNETPELDS